MEASQSDSPHRMHVPYDLNPAGRLSSVALLCVLLAGCDAPAPLTEARSTITAASKAGSDGTANLDAPPAIRTIRATGTIQAQRAYNIQVPQLSGQNTRISITNLVPMEPESKKVTFWSSLTAPRKSTICVRPRRSRRTGAQA